jgi:hypothetical protein
MPRPSRMTPAPKKTLGRRFRLPNVVSLRLQNYGRTSPLRLRGRFSLRQGYGGQGDAKEPDVAAGATDSASGRATRTGDASKDGRNRSIRLVPSSNPDHKSQVL